jgi:hypothetical protein
VFARIAPWLIAALLVGGCSVVYRASGPGPSPCCTYPPTPWPGGISRQEADQRALALVPATGLSEPTVVWTDFEFDPFVPAGAPDGKPVWVVRLQGAIAAPTCAPGYNDRAPSTADSLCLDWYADNRAIPGVNVVLDFYDGTLVGWLH